MPQCLAGEVPFTLVIEPKDDGVPSSNKCSIITLLEIRKCGDRSHDLNFSPRGTSVSPIHMLAKGSHIGIPNIKANIV